MHGCGDECSAEARNGVAVDGVHDGVPDSVFVTLLLTGKCYIVYNTNTEVR